MRSSVRTLLVVALATLAVSGCFGSQPDGGPASSSGQSTPPAQPPSHIQPDAQLAISGAWEAPFEGEVPAVSMALMHDGRILYWSGVEANTADGATDFVFFANTVPENASSRVLDLSGATPVIVTPADPLGAGADLFCAGQTVLADGRVLAIGSSVWSPDSAQELFLHGGTDARLFDPVTGQWERKADMLFGRWYPTAITLPDGRALVASGIGSLTNQNEQWEQVETYDPAADAWTYLEGADKLLPLYARLHLVPGGPMKGDLFYNTVGTLWGPFGEHYRQLEWSTQSALDLASPAWSDQGMSSYGARQHAASVMRVLDPARDYAPQFVNFGGTLYQSVVATPFTETVDLATNPPTNAMAASMNEGRWHLNGVLLPDDTILAVGGGRYDNVVVHGQPNVPLLSTELYDPEADTWTELASMSVPRMYHSTALLLPDGRVLAGGHVPLPNPFPQARETYNPQIKETRLEIFDPPYLFRGPRPVIQSAPEEATYAQTIPVDVDAEANVRDVVLIRGGSTTHAWDTNQRAIRLAYEVEGDHLNVHTPPDSIVAPPGWYMMFVMGQGDGGTVPSVASWVHLT